MDSEVRDRAGDDAATDARTSDLLDPDREPADADSPDAAADGGPVDAPAVTDALLVTSLSQPHHLVVDESHVYWVNGGSGQVQRAPKVGGTRELVSGEASVPAAIAVGGSQLVVADNVATGAVDRVLMKNKDGTGDVTILAQDMQLAVVTGRYAATVYATADTCYWLQTSAPAYRNLWRHPLGPGSSTGALSSSSAPRQLALFADRVVIVDPNDNTVRSLAQGFGDSASTSLLFDDPDNRNFYVLAGSASALFVALKAEVGKAAKIIRLTSLGYDGEVLAQIPDVDAGIIHLVHVVAMVADGDDVFFAVDKILDATSFGGRVYRVAAAGGSATLLASGQDPSGLALDSAYLYWSDSAANSIYRVPR